jgi:tRNA(fMet)-specific endonuclease VapC
MAVVVDSDVVSFVFKENTRSRLSTPHLVNVPKFISFMSLAELRRWKMQNNWGGKKTAKFDEFLLDFGVVHSDEGLCEIWAEIRYDAHKYGNPIDTADAWVAAVALLFDIPLVTNNRRHFENIKNLKIISKS